MLYYGLNTLRGVRTSSRTSLVILHSLDGVTECHGRMVYQHYQFYADK